MTQTITEFDQLPSIGPKTAAKLNKLGIYTPKDFLYHIPHRYLDFSKTISLASAP
jgi:ATP-dependent DNA helicase RecG